MHIYLDASPLLISRYLSLLCCVQTTLILSQFLDLYCPGSNRRMFPWAGTVLVWNSLRPAANCFSSFMFQLINVTSSEKLPWPFYLNNPSSLKPRCSFSYSSAFSFKAHIKIRNSGFICLLTCLRALSLSRLSLSSVSEKQCLFYLALYPRTWQIVGVQ